LHQTLIRLLIRASLILGAVVPALHAAEPQAGLSTFQPPAEALAGDVRVVQSRDTVAIDWPAGDERARLVLSLAKDRPLIRDIGIGARSVLADVDPAGVVTVGTRDLKQGWTVFFDNPRNRPFERFPLVLRRDALSIQAAGGHTRVVVDGASAGPFSGTFEFTVYPGSPLVRAAMVLSTRREATAYTFDAGLSAPTAASLPWQAIAYHDMSDALARLHGDALRQPAASPKVRGRTIVAEGVDGGALALLPPPHQYFYPLDYANNDHSAWYGRDYRGLSGRTGFGVRQTLEGDRRYVPWVNAPPGTRQDMGVFYLIDADDAASAARAAMAFTRGDRFKSLPGYRTFTSHYHVEHAVDFLNQARFQQASGVPAGLERPAFVSRFKAMNVEIVHLGELHLSAEDLDRAGDRLTLLKTIHEETARLSDDELLLLPGEEPNVHLGGHWVSLFPKPVYWTLDRKPGQPFVETDPKLGPIYHVGSAADVLRLMQAEQGLMWTAHPRIKSSTGYPDAYRDADFFRSDRYLGGAWKAMPADYSQPRLGTRVLDLLDDMNNWATSPSERKFTPGEVDVFQIDEQSELYAHMNINYLRLDGPLPRYEQGWQPVLTALRDGAFFTTTGEVLIPEFTVDGVRSGGQVDTGATATLRATLEWTFPPAFAEIVSGDGERVHRERIDLTDAPAFGTRTISRQIDLRGRKWVRLEVWDVAANGAFTQPVFVGR
jgi:hypothetical protein